ncbi:hypothetical protein L596_016883 [Steinernema carpocapsae]|uniref:EGF-like domain-containing protein n=1 Tax=Steinernema carpocapsae TaxID=34508 RepID=A0A4U5NKJ0_STECR|nr:hypothetical protein L596_016883 [Steinernema carpocapsae]
MFSALILVALSSVVFNFADADRYFKTPRITCVHGDEENGKCICDNDYVGTHCQFKMMCSSYERHLNGTLSVFLTLLPCTIAVGYDGIGFAIFRRSKSLFFLAIVKLVSFASAAWKATPETDVSRSTAYTELKKWMSKNAYVRSLTEANSVMSWTRKMCTTSTTRRS